MRELARYAEGAPAADIPKGAGGRYARRSHLSSVQCAADRWRVRLFTWTIATDVLLDGFGSVTGPLLTIAESKRRP